MTDSLKGSKTNTEYIETHKYLRENARTTQTFLET